MFTSKSIINNIKSAGFPGAPTQFRYISELKETQQGAIFCAEIVSTSQPVAIKISEAGLVDRGVNKSGEEIGENFLQERQHTLHLTRALESSSFSGPSPIISALDAWDERNEEDEIIAYCLMLEFVPGGKDLFDVGAEKWNNFYHTGNPRPVQAWVAVVRPIFQELVAAVDLIHQHGIVHFDLSPENILVTPDGHIRVIDFGTSEFWRTNRDRVGEEDEEKSDDDVVTFSGFRGKPGYCAPEMFMENRKYDGRAADIFSLGAILLFLIGGVGSSDRKHLRCIQSKGCQRWLKEYERDFAPRDAMSLVDNLLLEELFRPTMNELREDAYVMETVDWENDTVNTCSLNTEGFNSSEGDAYS